MKKPIDVEKLLQWACVDELSKLETGSGGGWWDRLAQYGYLGGVNPASGAARWGDFHIGDPHPDAVTVGKAIMALGKDGFDWREEFEIVAAELAGYLSINDISKRPRGSGDTSGLSGFGRGQIDNVAAKAYVDAAGRHSVRYEAPKTGGQRDVLLLRTINTAALVATHAIKKTRPDWSTEPMRLLPTVAERGRQDLALVLGKRLAKDLYAHGSHCPLRFEPSPIEIVEARADYRVWHRALCALAATLDLGEYGALPPSASAAPWLEDPEKKASHWSQPVVRSKPLPLKPVRDRAGPPPQKPRHSKVRRIKVDTTPIS